MNTESSPNPTWQAAKAIALWILLTLIMYCISSCQLIPSPISDDWVHVPPPPDPLPLEADTCETLTEVDTPAWVTMYMLFDDAHDSILWEGGGEQSYDLADVVAAITPLASEVDAHPIGASVYIRGTLDHQQYQLKIFARLDGAKWYLGTGRQYQLMPGATYETYIDRQIRYPGANTISYWGTAFDSLQYMTSVRQILADCKEGRYYVDLLYIPFDLPQTLRDSLWDYNWDRVRNAQPNSYVIDLRHIDVTPEQLRWYAMSGQQIIVRDDGR